MLLNRNAPRTDLKSALRKAVRGAFRFNSNHYPVQDYYLRLIARDEKGGITNRIVGTIFKNHADAYVGACKM